MRQNFSMRRAQILYALRQFGGDFEALYEVQIDLMIAHWKALDVCYPTQVECFNLDVIFPSKTAISQDWFLLAQKVAEMPFLECFWPFRQPSIL